MSAAVYGYCALSDFAFATARASLACRAGDCASAADETSVNVAIQRIIGVSAVSKPRLRLARRLAAVRRPIGRPRARRPVTLDEIRILAREIRHHRRERRVVLEIIEHDLVVRVALRMPGVRKIVP